jgi:hypothetical protein
MNAAVSPRYLKAPVRLAASWRELVGRLPKLPPDAAR